MGITLDAGKGKFKIEGDSGNIADVDGSGNFCVKITGARQYGANVFGDFSPWSAKNGTSASIPFTNTDFETDASIHDPTAAISSTATSGAAATLTDTAQTWTVNVYIDYIVKITGGTGAGQWRKVLSNTVDTLTVDANWGTNPDATSTYELYEKAHKLIVPEDGIYHVLGHASIAYQAGPLGVFFYVNGVFNSLNYTHQGQTIELNGGNSKIINLAQNDELEMRVYNGNAAHQNMFGGSARLYFSLARFG